VSGPVRRCGFVKKTISPFLLISLVVFLCAVPGELRGGELSYPDQLIQRAHQKRLHEDPYWRILLHYQNKLFGVQSLIDDPQFFLSIEGKENPMAELDATLRAFFQDDTISAGSSICRFIARYTWLKEKLSIDESKLPAGECSEFNKTMELIKPRSATLIFPAAYMNNPASMFGHTLINIETPSQSKLLSHAVNYSAYTQENNGVVFAVKGIGGFYKGYFSILPYYEKVQEYNDISHRDIWEYRLNLTEDEVRNMVMHIWELQKIYSYYYFFGENCSYNLLFLLDAARPSLRMVDRFKWWVIPIDTVKALYRSGLVESVHYRPAQATKIRYMSSIMKSRSRKMAETIAANAMDPALLLNTHDSQEDKIKILDLAVEYLQYRYGKEKVSRDDYSSLFLSILTARSTLGRPEGLDYAVPRPTSPEKGHGSKRLSVGFGYGEDRSFQEIRLRPAYHDLMDDDAGYIPGSQIQFCDTRLRYYFSDRKFELEEFNLIDIISLSERDMFFKPFSWKAQTGLMQKRRDDGDNHLIYYLSTGGGFAYRNRFLGLYYGMMESDLNFGGSFESNHALGAGASMGLHKKITSFWKLHLHGKALYYPVGDEHKSYELSLAQNITLSPAHAFTAKLSRTKTFGFCETEAVFMWNIYF